jgi:hypothetical protein
VQVRACWGLVPGVCEWGHWGCLWGGAALCSGGCVACSHVDGQLSQATGAESGPPRLCRYHDLCSPNGGVAPGAVAVVAPLFCCRGAWHGVLHVLGSVSGREARSLRRHSVNAGTMRSKPRPTRMQNGPRLDPVSFGGSLRSVTNGSFAHQDGSSSSSSSSSSNVQSPSGRPPRGDVLFLTWM